MEVRISQSVSEGPFDFKITRVDCMQLSTMRSLTWSILSGKKKFLIDMASKQMLASDHLRYKFMLANTANPGQTVMSDTGLQTFKCSVRIFMITCIPSVIRWSFFPSNTIPKI